MRKKKKKWTKLGHNKLKTKKGEKQNQVFTNDLLSMENSVGTPTDTTWSIGRAIPQTLITEITVPDIHILQEPDNLSTIPQLFRKTPSHTPVSEARIPDIQIWAKPDNSSSLAHTITKLADSVFKFNQLYKWCRKIPQKGSQYSPICYWNIQQWA